MTAPLSSAVEAATIPADKDYTLRQPLNVEPLTLRNASPVCLPATLDLRAFRDNIQFSWMSDHFAHRPRFQQLVTEGAESHLGVAAECASFALCSMLFTRMFEMPLFAVTKRIEKPYGAAYASAVRTLALQLPNFNVAQVEQLLVPVLLLFTLEVPLAPLNEVIS